MSSFRARSVKNTVDARFRPMAPALMLRRGFWTLATLAVLYAATREVDGWLYWALIVFAFWRTFAFVVTGFLVNDVNAEIEKRRQRFGIVP